jgi:hypothetical protein
MMSGDTTHIRSTFRKTLFASVLFIALPLSVSAANDAGGFRGAAFKDTPVHSVDFRSTTTLGEFDRIVYRNRWRGIDAEDVITEFKKFDGVAGSPVMRDIWRDVLLGDFEGLSVSGAQQSQLMAERLRLLNRLGFFDEAARLYVEAAQERPIAEIVARQGIEAMALAGSADGACLETLMAVEYLKGEEWIQNAALCSAYLGENDKAEEYYDAASKKSGSGFRALYKALRKGESPTIQTNIPPLWRALMLSRGAALNPETLRKADAMTLASISASKKIPLGTRLVAAGRAADFGTVGADRLRKLYEMKHRTDGAVTGIVEKIKLDEALPQSDYYAAARFVFEGTMRSTIVRKAVNVLSPRTNIKSHVYGWITDKLTLQKPERIKAFAKQGYALMVATDRYASAEYYYKAGDLQKSTLSIVEAILQQKPWTPEEQKQWQAAMKDAGLSEKATRKAYLTVKAFDIESKLALNQNAAIAVDAPKSVTLLQDSVKNGGKGLTLISALNLLAKAKNIGSLSTDEVSDIIAILGKQGQFGERKKLALEILLQTVL